jgi:hypothetical protein
MPQNFVHVYDLQDYQPLILGVGRERDTYSAVHRGQRLRL